MEELRLMRIACARGEILPLAVIILDGSEPSATAVRACGLRE
jgi:hypothetical protein